MERPLRRSVHPRLTALAFVGVIVSLVHVATPVGVPLEAASSSSCDGGGFSVTTTGGIFAAPFDGQLAASTLGPIIQVRGRYVEFDIVSATFAVQNYVFTGAANPEDITGGVRTPVFKRKTPEGVTLTGNVALELGDSDLLISRAGSQTSIKISAKDCAQGGIFQMEPQRADGGVTRITHVLATATDDPRLTPFYFDNPNFRAREGDTVPYKDTTIKVPLRINFANDFSKKFVGRDSTQVATRVNQDCPNQFVSRVTGQQTINHCGGVSLWDVASGGRMGMVMGGDATEVAPAATNCIQNCQAQNRVRGQAVNLGFPFHVPDTSRLKPRFPAGFVP